MPHRASMPDSPRHSCPKFTAQLNEHFPGTQREGAFFDGCVAALSEVGFKDNNTIACVGVCRDEICGSLMDEVKRRFGDLFIFRGLAGFIFCGKTGFGAAHAHSPYTEDGRDRYLYVIAPHVGISSEGVLGAVDRRGRSEASSACGALKALLGMLQSGHLDTALKLDDIEMSVIQQLMARNIRWGDVPDMAELTKLALQVIIKEQLNEIIRETVDTNKADYAVIAGVQIHGPGIMNNYFAPDAANCYAVVNGKRTSLDVSAERPRIASMQWSGNPAESGSEVTSNGFKHDARPSYIPAAGPCASPNLPAPPASNAGSNSAPLSTSSSGKKDKQPVLATIKGLFSSGSSSSNVASST